MSVPTKSENVSDGSKVYGTLHYVCLGHQPELNPRPFELPGGCDFQDQHITPLHDLRPLLTLAQISTGRDSESQLLKTGFTAVKHPSRLHSAPHGYLSWHDPTIVQAVYVPEAKEMLKKITGARTVIVETILLRSFTSKSSEDASIPTGHTTTHAGSEKVTNSESAQAPSITSTSAKDGSETSSSGLPLVVGFSDSVGSIGPIPKVHLDYTSAGARTHIRHFHPTISTACAAIIEAEDKLTAASLPLDSHYHTSVSAPRWAFYSVWRPLKRVKRDPLAMGDNRSFAAEDYGKVGVMAPTMDSEGVVKGRHAMEAYVGRRSEGQRWCYVSEQMPEEVLLIGLWDSDREHEGIGRTGAMHSSVELEGCENEEPRESVELRCLAIW